MTNKLQKLPPSWHSEAVEMLTQNFEQIHRTFLDSTKRAVWLGLFLNHVKARGKEDGSIPHGEFGPWLQKNVPELNRDTCTTYMQLATNVAEKGNFQITEFPKFAQGGHLPPALENIVEGKTQAQLCFEFKREKAKLQPRTPVRMSAQEAVAAEVSGCEAAAADLIVGIGIFIGLGDLSMTSAPIYRCSPSKRQELLDWSVKLNNAIRDLQRSKN